MSQNQVTDYNIDPFTTSGQALAALLNRLHEALLTMHSGAARPPYAKIGTVWFDTSTTPGVLKIYDGANDKDLDGILAGGAKDEVLTKLSGTDGDVGWAAPNKGAVFPPGGDVGEVLVKKSIADDDVEWGEGLPPGGTTGEALIRLADGSADWQPVANAQQVHHGPGAPDPTLGKDGDLYYEI